MGTHRLSHSATSHLSSSDVPGWLYVVITVLAAFSLFTPQPILGMACWGTVLLLTYLAWRDAEPPILLFGAVKLWTVASAQVIYYGIVGRSLHDVGGPEVEQAIWLVLVSSCVIFLGIRTSLAGAPTLSLEQLHTEAMQLSIERIFFAYLLSYLASAAFDFGDVAALGGIAQFLLALKLIRWVLFFLLTFACLSQEEGYRFLIVAIVVETIVGLLGFWGSFKEFFPIFVVAYLGARRGFRPKEFATTFVVFALVLFLGLFWTAIKPDYRDFLTGGQRTQRIVVPMSAQAVKIVELAGEVDSRDLQEAVEPAMKRVGYVDYFAETIEYIPEYRPYDDGSGWKNGIMHVLKPRLFFPNKPAIHDSEITRKYTGLNVASASQGTSISIGYIGESYADFGPWFMFVPIFFVGIGYGFMYRYFLVTGNIKLLGMAFAAAFLPTMIGGQPSIPRLLGNSITQFVVMGGLLWVAGPSLYRLLLKRSPEPSPFPA